MNFQDKSYFKEVAFVLKSAFSSTEMWNCPSPSDGPTWGGILGENLWKVLNIFFTQPSEQPCEYVILI